MLRLDPAQEMLTSSPRSGSTDGDRSRARRRVDDLSATRSSSRALARARSVGDGAARATQRIPFAHWIALPLPQPHVAARRRCCPRSRAAELLAPLGVHLLLVRATPARGSARAGAASSCSRRTAGDAVVEALARARDVRRSGARPHGALADRRAPAADRSTQERDRLTRIIDSLPDPVVITNAANDIIVQNARAERLLHARDSDSDGPPPRGRAEQPAVHVVPRRAVMTGGSAGGPRELNLVDPDEGNDLLFEVLAHPLGERVGRRTPCSRCCATSPTCGARPTSSSGRCSACGSGRDRGARASATGST